MKFTCHISHILEKRHKNSYFLGADNLTSNMVDRLDYTKSKYYWSFHKDELKPKPT